MVNIQNQKHGGGLNILLLFTENWRQENTTPFYLLPETVSLETVS